MNIKFGRDIAIAFLTALFSWVIFFLFLFLFLGGTGSGSLGGGMLAIGEGILVFQVWIIFTIFFVPISIILIFKKIIHTQSNFKEVVSTTIFCFFLISIPILVRLGIERAEDIKMEKSYKVTDEFAEAYESAIKKVDPRFCDKLNSKNWKQKEKETDYNNENIRTYRQCCLYSFDWVLSDEKITEEGKWNFCLNTTEYEERHICYSELLKKIDPKTRSTINLDCDFIKNETVAQECFTINERILAEIKALESYDPHKFESFDMSACDELDSFQKAICYSFVASTMDGYGICNKLDATIVAAEDSFFESDKTEKEICEFYREARLGF